MLRLNVSLLGNSFLAVGLLTFVAIFAAGCGGGAANNAATSASSAGSAGSGSGSSGSGSSGSGSGSSGSGSTSASNSITVSSPANGTSVKSPFTLSATASTCSSQAVTSVGYSLDGSADTTAVNGASLNTQVSAQAGTHTLYVKAWGSDGASCYATVVLDVTSSASTAASNVPSNAVAVNNIQSVSGWQANHDPATGATSSGAMAVVSSPAINGASRQFNTSFSGSGGEIYNVIFGADTASANFFYDGWVYLTSSSGSIQNLEMDMNQVLSNGDTVIYGFQCDGISGTWDYTENSGTLSNPVDTWVHSGAPCNVRTWSQNTWHHVQISYSRDDSGNVTYDSVWLDGAESQINATVPSEFALGWTSSLLTNFQIDGIGSGSNTVYLDQLTISRW